MPEQKKLLSDPWFDQWPQTDGYRASDGYVNRIPLRLASTNVVLYGAADTDEVLKEFEHENYRPVTVGGDVPVQIWCNNFLDTDCGPPDRVNPYTEIWYSFPVTEKPDRLELPFESPFSYNVVAPNALVWVHRVLCGRASDGYETGTRAAIAGGREIWGFPKHPAIADLSFRYDGDDIVEFEGALQGKKAISLRVRRPEAIDGCITIPLDERTGPDTCVTPNQHPVRPGFIPKQTRYGQAFAATMHFAPWDEGTDSLTVYAEEDHFGSLLKSWDFKPALKMHCSDLRVVAFKPAGWDYEQPR